MLTFKIKVFLPILLFAAIANFACVAQKNFYFSHIRGNITVAREHCQSLTGRLVSILTGNQDTDLRYFLGVNDGTTVHTSGFRNNEGWFWTVTNVSIPMRYTNWRPDQPYGTNECLAVRGLGLQYGWYSVPCSHKLQFICEID